MGIRDRARKRVVLPADAVPTWHAVLRSHVSLRLCLNSILNLVTWLLLTGLLLGQIFGIVLTSVTTSGHTFYGQPLDKGLYNIPGLNDEPYSDRAVACVQSGRTFRPAQLSQLLRQHKQAAPIPITYATNGRDAYRVVSRDSFTMDPNEYYTSHCNALSTTITAIFVACERLGYNVTRDVLRVVDGIDSHDIIAIPKTLPVLILPYWDTTLYARYAVPSYDGSACVFHTSGMFEDATDPTAELWGVSREVRENKTATWLGYPGGVWRHGWYEDPVLHMRWYSDVFSTQPNGPYGVEAHRFDLLKEGEETYCSEADSDCLATKWLNAWGDELSIVYQTPWYHSIIISNGSRFGLFLYENLFSFTLQSRYSLQRLISNASLTVLLVRWMVLMIALYPVDTIGLAALANASSFHYLPLLLLPRLRSSLEGFWTSGCVFNGDQSAMENAWFTIYPAIGEVVVLYFSILNIVAKVLRRRMSDVMFGPTLLFFVLLHRCRGSLAALNLLDGDTRVSGVVTAQEVAAASVIDYFTTNLAFRVDGEVKTIFFAKLIVLGINLVPLLLTSRRVVDAPTCKDGDRLQIEKALGIQFASTGGLGSTVSPIQSLGGVSVLRPYELVRAGYLVVGADLATSKLMGVTDWVALLASSCVNRAIYVPFRVLVYDMTVPINGDKRGAEVNIHPVFVRGDASSPIKTNVMSISACTCR